MNAIEANVAWGKNLPDRRNYGYENYVEISNNAAAKGSGGVIHIIYDTDSDLTLTTVQSRYSSAPKGSEIHAPNAPTKRFYKTGTAGSSWVEGVGAYSTVTFVDSSGTAFARLRVSGTEFKLELYQSGSWVEKQNWS